jgi:hypothetical protein
MYAWAKERTMSSKQTLSISEVIETLLGVSLPIREMVDEEEGGVEERSFDTPFDEDGELVGHQVKVTEDKEVEHFFTSTEIDWYAQSPTGVPVTQYEFVRYPTWIFNDSPWLTSGGNETWAGWSGLPPYWKIPTPPSTVMVEGLPEEVLSGKRQEYDCPNYHTPTSTAWQWGKAADRKYMQWMLWIRKCEDKALLQQQWNRFWRQFYASKKANKPFALSPKQVKAVKAAFEAKGIKAKGK